MNERVIRRIALWALAIGALVIIGGLGLGLWLSFFSDGPPPDISDLEPHRVAIPDNENGFVALNGIDALVKMSANSNHNNWFRQTEWDQGNIDSLLIQHQPALELLDKSLAKPRFQSAKIEAPNWDIKVWPLRNLGDIKTLSAINHWRQNQRQRAVGEDMGVIEAGRRLEKSEGILVHFASGLNMEKRALETLCWFANHADSGERPEMESVLARLEQDIDRNAALSDSMRNAAVYYRDCFSKFASGKMTFKDYYGGKPLPLIQKRMLLQPNTTMSMYAEAIRQIIRDAPLTYDKIDKEPGALKRQNRMSPYKLALSPNLAGIMMFRETFTIYGSWISRKYLITTQTGMTRALIATRLYWLDRGKLPATLDDLVPAYLKSVPLDAYDGKPLRYSPTNKVIYSVGRDLIDKGGDMTDGNQDRDHQPTVKIGW